MCKCQGWTEPGNTVHSDKIMCLQFDQILAAYKAQSRNWKPVINKFAEGEPYKFYLSRLIQPMLYFDHLQSQQHLCY